MAKRLSALLERMQFAHCAAQQVLRELDELHFEEVDAIHEHFSYDPQALQRLGEFLGCIEGVAQRGKQIL